MYNNKRDRTIRDEKQEQLTDALQAGNVIKETLQYRCFPVNIAKFLKTPILKNL